VLQEQRGTLSSWRIAIDTEYKSILRSLLIRAAFIAGALVLLALASQLWGRATVRYVSDLRRRRQLLVVRRVVIGFVGGLILIFGFVTQFSSLATFAGFISAGIAVGLQTILLSVAAYFFIIGRYGVRVGDRITVAGVTGTVIEVGIARFYMMELVGTGTELHSTGRVAVFANSVLFQTGTPLYKQLPGTEYAWHELTAKLKPEADAEAVSKAICDIIDGVYQTYKAEIESQQHQIESWMGAPVDRPGVDSHLRMVEEGLQIAILFPVQIAAAAKTDAAIAAAIFRALQVDGPLKQGLAALPTIKAAIRF
jgi:small-conductance mechanosensitive channel